MDDEDRARHIDGVAHARAALRRHDHIPNPPSATAPAASPPTDPAWSPDVIAAQLASGAERDALEARITDLEHEVHVLRSALAKIAHEVAHAINPTTS